MSWLEGFVPPKKKRTKTVPPPPPPPPPEVEADGLPVVVWAGPVRCYYCRSKRCKVNRTQGRVRYHICRDCGKSGAYSL